MRRIALPSLLLLLAGGAASAGDFSGFYAGVHAGYATGRDGARSAAPAGSGPTAAGRGRDDPALPPSAADAAAAMKGAGRTGPRPAPAR